MSESPGQENFRTTLRKQMRRLSATKMPAKQPLTVPDKHLNGQAGLRTVMRHTPPDSKNNSFEDEDEHEDENEDSAEDREVEQTMMQKSASLSRDHGSLTLKAHPLSCSTPPASSKAVPIACCPTPPLPLLCRTPPTTMPTTALPPDSPLLRPRTPTSPMAKRAREINREIRRARSFRQSIERSRESSRNRNGNGDRSDSPSPTHSEPTVVSFSVRKQVCGRAGWKIMPRVDVSAAVAADAVALVVERIRELELSGKPVPETIAVKIQAN